MSRQTIPELQKALKNAVSMTERQSILRQIWGLQKELDAITAQEEQEANTLSLLTENRSATSAGTAPACSAG